VMATVVPVAEALAVQLVNPLPKVTVGEAGTVKAELKTTVTALPPAREPVELVVNPTVQVAVLFSVEGEPVKATFVTAVAAATTTSEGLAAAVSAVVFTLNVLPV
jgi:hypothetical protein